MTLSLPMQPRVVKADSHVKDLQGMAAIAVGPVVYSFEECDNKDVKDLKINTAAPMKTVGTSEFGGSVILTGTGVDKDGKDVEFRAVPYYAVGNRHTGEAYKVWTDVKR